MIPIDPKLLRDRLKSDGRTLEKLFYELLQADAAACGLPMNVVHWDDRTTAPDGGKDLVVTAGVPDGRALLIRTVPSVWSVKSGDDGRSVAKFEEELAGNKRHHILQDLKEGRDFVWCALAAGHDQRASLERKAKELAKQHGFSAERIAFWFGEQIASVVERFAGVVLSVLPDLADRIGQSVEEWSRGTPWLDTRVPWVNFDARDEIVESIRQHFLSPQSSRLLHVGGVSGIGKTRSVLQAVSTDCELARKVIYYANYEALQNQFVWLRATQNARVWIVVDETTVEQWYELNCVVGGFGDGIRILSVGPLTQDQRPRPGIIVLPKPMAPDSIMKVVTAASGAKLDEDICRDIAAASHHDLRLGILLVSAILSDPQLARYPDRAIEVLREPRLIFDRVLKLFQCDLRSVPKFTDDYPLFSFAAEVGVRRDMKTEVCFLAEELKRDPGDMMAAADVAHKCGLGNYVGERFFETSPRALGTLAFETFLWPRIEMRIKELLERIPSDRLLRSFVRRVELCGAAVREKAGRACGEYFRERLCDVAVFDLSKRDLARTFSTWAEIYPTQGLAWLKTVVREASLEQLREFRGSSAIFGPSGGRRDIVWLCENLACFEEHFASCEEVLFRLALAENESIGNNASNSWKERFRIVLSNTEVAFASRTTLLLRRLSESTADHVALPLGAALGSLEPHISIMAPPEVVGGRIVPPEWRPKTNAEASALLDDLVLGVIVALEASTTAAVRAAGACFVAAHIDRFWRPRAGVALRRFLTAELDDMGTRLLRQTLQDLLDIHGEKFPGLEQIRTWIADLEPQDLVSLIKDVVGRPVWDHRSHARRAGEDAESWKEPYRAVALKLLQQPGILDDIFPWLGSAEARSARALGAVLAEQDGSDCDEVCYWVEKAIDEGICDEFVIGYLATLRQIQKTMPNWASNALTMLVHKAPTRAAQITAEADPSKDGLDRVLVAVGKDGMDRARSLQKLFGYEWKSVLTPSDCSTILAALVGGGSGDPPPHYVMSALHILSMWKEEAQPPPEELHGAIVQLATRPGRLAGAHSLYEWNDVARQAIAIDPNTVIPRLVEFAFDFEAREENRFFGDDAVKLLTEAGRRHGDLILQAVTPYLRSPKTSIMFSIGVYRGFFEAIGAERVIPWIESIGNAAARAVARHILSPSVGDKGTLEIPPITAWILERYGSDGEVFESFMMGRHSFEIRTGRAEQWGPPRRQAAEPFVNHPIPAVARWAKAELEDLAHEVRLDQRWEAEEERM